jgi:hypothetical protein
MTENAAHVLALEAEAATLTANVSQKKKELDAITQNSERLEKGNLAAEEQILHLKQQQELVELFYTTLIQSDRKSLDRLEELGNSNGYLEAERAKGYWNAILNSIASHAEVDLSDTSWAKDTLKLSLADLVRRYHGEPEPSVKIALLQTLARRSDIPKKDRLTFLYEIIEKENNIQISTAAGRALIKITGLGFPPLARREILEWWTKNASKIQ